MSFSIAVSGTKDEIAQRAREAFQQNYPEPVPGVQELFEAGAEALEGFASSSGDEGNYSASVSGHAKQSDTDRDSLSISINAVS